MKQWHDKKLYGPRLLKGDMCLYAFGYPNLKIYIYKITCKKKRDLEAAIKKEKKQRDLEAAIEKFHGE